jgi:hypothetical protein
VVRLDGVLGRPRTSQMADIARSLRALTAAERARRVLSISF